MGSLDLSFRKQGDPVTRTLAQETLIVPVASSYVDLDSVYVLDDVGALLWGLVDGTTTVRGMVEAVTREFEVAEEQAESDILSFLGSLQQSGLIEPCERAG